MEPEPLKKNEPEPEPLEEKLADSPALGWEGISF